MSVRKRLIQKKVGTTMKWEASVMPGDGVRVRRMFSTKAEAQKFETEAKHNIHSGTYRKGSETKTTGAFLEEFLEHLENRRARAEITRGYVKSVVGHVRNYIMATSKSPSIPYATPFFHGISHYKLQNITRGSVEDFKERLRTAGVTVANTRAILRSLHAALEYAQSRDLVYANPAARVRVKGLRNEAKDKVKPPTPFMIEAALQAADVRMKAEILLAAVTGIRASEQVALRWNNVNFPDQLLWVETRVDTWLEEDVPKSIAGVRRIPLKPSVVEALQKWREIAPARKSNELIFPGRSGGFRNHGAMTNRRWNPIRDALGAQFPHEDVDTHWHALRHFAVSCWIATDINWKKIQTWIGHSDISFTMNRYGHIFEDGVNDPAILDSIRRIYGQS